jgi:hypothetical protein
MARHRSVFARRPATRLPKSRFIIYCEGEKTEPGYFNALGRVLRGSLIELELQPTGVPKTIAERAVKRARQEGLAKASRRRPQYSFQANDQVWAVFDRDEHPSYEQSIDHCTHYGVGVGRSNPCFEIWLILHDEDFHRSDDRHQVCRHLRKLHPEYDPDGSKSCDWPKLIEHIEMAEIRAAEQLEQREREGTPYGRPSTTVGHLTAAIREAAAKSKP